MRFAAVYGVAAAMGFTPQEARKMSMWQFTAALDGYIEANYTDSENTLSAEEQDDLWDWLQGKG